MKGVFGILQGSPGESWEVEVSFSDVLGILEDVRRKPQGELTSDCLVRMSVPGHESPGFLRIP